MLRLQTKIYLSIVGIREGGGPPGGGGKPEIFNEEVGFKLKTNSKLS